MPQTVDQQVEVSLMKERHLQDVYQLKCRGLRAVVGTWMKANEVGGSGGISGTDVATHVACGTDVATCGVASG